MDFSGFDFSEMFKGAQAETEARRRSRGGGGAGASRSGSFKDIFSQFFHGGGGRSGARQAPEKGADLEYGLNISFWQAIRGTQAKIEITRYDQCPTATARAATSRVDRLPAMQRHRQRDARWRAT